MRGTVSDVSATFVASTMRRCGPGLNTRSCSAADRRAYSGSTSVSRYLRRDNARCASRISRSPGRNTSTSPRGSLAGDLVGTRRRSARRVLVLAALAAPAASAPRPDKRGLRPRRPARSSKCAAKRSVSIVAEVTMSFRSAPLRQQALQIAEQEIDVEAALVRLVEDDRVVRAEPRIATAFRRAGCRRS